MDIPKDSKDIPSNFKRKSVYWERQAYDKLCGIHCINCVMQGPYFDVVSMSTIAQKFDELEKELLGLDYKINSNVDDDGNYNIQVLQEALKIHNIELIPLKKNEAEKLLTESYDQLEAFIFNSTTHWFSIRKIDGIWFNLNSCNPHPGPQMISDFYLSAFIKGTEDLGFSNFILKNLNKLPEFNDPIYSNLKYNQKIVSIEEILKNKPKKLNMGDCDDEQLEKALELSKLDLNVKKEDFDAPFYETNFKNIQDFEEQEDFNSINQYEDKEMQMVMELSLNLFIENLEKELLPEPPNDSESIKIQFKSKDKILERKFRKNEKIRQLKLFLQIKSRTYGIVRIFEEFSKKEFENEESTLIDQGITSNIVLNYQVIE